MTPAKSYPGTGFVDRRAAYVTESGQPFKYERLPQFRDGLTLHAPARVDFKTQGPNREHDDAKDIFLHRDKTGHVDAYISCGNRRHKAAPCRHDFSLGPFMPAQVYIIYCRGPLSEWQQIKSSVSQVLTHFAVAGR